MPAAEPDETTHFSVIDRDGLAVTSTYTLEGGYGSHVVVKGTGFLLNNEMGDFNKKPGETNLTGDIGTPANLIDSRQAHAELDDADDRGQGWQGGAADRIAGRPHDHQHRLRHRARGHRVWIERPAGRRPARACIISGCPIGATLEEGAVPDEVLAALRAMGHEVRAQSRQGDAHSIWVAPDGTPYGVQDKRSADAKASVPRRLTPTAAGR